MKKKISLLLLTAFALCAGLTLSACAGGGAKGKGAAKEALAWQAIAHRGLHGGGLPENSTAAFLAAMRGGYAIETDVWLTKDGHAVLVHDENLKRVTGEDKLVTELTLEEVLALRLQDTDEKVPTLEELLLLVKGEVPLIIELKKRADTEAAGELEKKVAAAMKKYTGDYKKYAIQSFNPFSVDYFRTALPKAYRGLLTAKASYGAFPGAQKNLMRDLTTDTIKRVDFLAVHTMILSSAMVKSRPEGMQVFAWTIRSIGAYDKALRSADNCIFENFEP